MPKTLDLLVFDWDGTLMDSVATIVRCMQESVAELGLEPVSEDAVRGTIGLGLDDAMRALGIVDDDDQRRRLVERYSANWISTYRHEPSLFPGAEDALVELREQGFLLAVATGKSRRGLDRELGVTGLGDLFHATRTADEAFSKPHPKMLHDLLDDLGVIAEKALMIGDTTFDLEMARNAGVHGVAVTCGSHRRDVLDPLDPIAVFDRVADLPPWLTGRGTRPASASQSLETSR